MQSVLISVVIILLVAGLLILLVRKASFLDAELREWGVYAISAIAIVMIVLKLLVLIGAGM